MKTIPLQIPSIQPVISSCGDEPRQTTLCPTKTRVWPNTMLGISHTMEMRTPFFLLTLMVAFVGCSIHRSSSGRVPSILPDIHTGHYKVDPYIQAAVELQALGRSNALVRLHSMAQDEKLEKRVIVLCRMLFTRRPGGDFRRPMIGGAGFLGGTDYQDWPLEPIELVDGVPFLITRGYEMAGFPEPDEWYLRYCETNCDWSGFRYTIKSKSQKRDALRKLLSSPKWKTPLDADETQFFAKQIQ